MSATKTLGIKFEVVGVKEAQAGLNNLRKNLNQSIQHNKQAVNESLKLRSRFVREATCGASRTCGRRLHAAQAFACMKFHTCKGALQVHADKGASVSRM